MPRGVRRAQLKLLTAQDITEIQGVMSRAIREVSSVISRATGVPVPQARFSQPVKRTRKKTEKKAE